MDISRNALTDQSFRDEIWHGLSPAQALERLRSGPSGLDEAEARARLDQVGPNKLPEPPKRAAIVRLLLQFHNVLIYVLLGAAVITGLLGHFVDTGVILAVVLINAAIGFIQEGRAEQAMEAIRHMLAPTASVLRDGERRSTAGEDLVPGDVVVLEAGDRVPADLRLLESHGLQTQEAILTGESVPSEKHSQTVDPSAALGDRHCMAFSGTLVTAGEGTGLVVATGGATQIGRISGLLSGLESLTTPLIQQMDHFARWLTLLILLVAALLLVFGYFVQNQSFSEMFMAVVGLSVAAIPEGLPAVLTITLAIGVQAMARRSVIVRRLPAIETLGSVSVICTDKTGTLTRNEMMVSSLATHSHIFTLDGEGYTPEGQIKLSEAVIEAAEHDVLSALARAAVLCNNAALRRHDGVWKAEGDPMEAALLAFAGKTGSDIRQTRAAWTRTDAIPFDTQHRFMATLNHDHENNAFVFVKGAPEKILSMCKNQYVSSDRTAALDEAYWKAKAHEIAAQGQRVIALARRAVEPVHTVLEFSDVEGGLTLLGLAGLIDPPRQEAVQAIRDCRGAGIAVKMITGDHAATAAAIARDIGLENPDRVLEGVDLDGMDDAALAAAALETNIFARTSPEHKLRLVKALQSRGDSVAMTGDGVNDAPALKQADAGVAMGTSGSEAAKEAAELVLVDDNFKSIVDAIREGRTVYDNIKKVITWTLPTNAGESMTIMTALLLGMTLPITPIQILWVNLVTATTLGLALAFEPTEENTMRKPPRARDEPILTGELVWHVIFVSVLFLCGVFGIYRYAIEQGYSIELARTLALNTLVVMEIFHLFFVRNIYGTSLTWSAIRGTKIIWAMVLAVTAAQFSITYAPPLQQVFGTQPVSLMDGALVVGIGIVLFALAEIEKQIRLTIRAGARPSPA